MELEDGKGGNESLAAMLTEYKVSLQKSKTKLKKWHLRCFAHVKQFKGLEQEFQVFCTEKHLLQKSALEAISSSPAKHEMDLTSKRE